MSSNFFDNYKFKDEETRKTFERMQEYMRKRYEPTDPEGVDLKKYKRAAEICNSLETLVREDPAFSYVFVHPDKSTARDWTATLTVELPYHYEYLTEEESLNPENLGYYVLNTYLGDAFRKADEVKVTYDFFLDRAKFIFTVRDVRIGSAAGGGSDARIVSEEQ